MDRPPHTLFTTRGLPPSSKLTAWRDSIGVMFDVAPDPLAPAGAFDAEVEAFMIGDLLVGRCRASAQKFDRRALRIASDGIDHYMFQVFRAGGVDMQVGSRRLTAGSGLVVGFDLAEILDSWNEGFDALTVMVPRARLAPLLDLPDSIHGAQVPATGLGYLLAENIAMVFREAPTLTMAEAQSLAGVLLQLIASAFNSRADDTTTVRRSLEFNQARRIRTYILEHLKDPELGPETVAAACGVSRATLFRLFQGQGGVRGFIMEQRLRASLRTLVDPSTRASPVSQIAYRFGFASPSHFTRVFRERFGVTPTEAREAAGSVRRWQPHGAAPAPDDPEYAAWIATLG